MNKLFLFVVGAAVLIVGGASWQALSSDSALTAQMTEVQDSEAAEVMGGACLALILIDHSLPILTCYQYSKGGARCPAYGRIGSGPNILYNYETRNILCYECSVACGNTDQFKKCLPNGSADLNGSWEHVPPIFND